MSYKTESDRLLKVYILIRNTIGCFIMTVVVIKLLPLLCLVCIGGQSLQSQIGANHVVKRGFDFSKCK